MKGTIYGNWLPKGYASEKSLGTTGLDEYIYPDGESRRNFEIAGKLLPD